ncbi:hypothetical protein F9U64_15400 [Gracilibacillus oryzae]|uniref:Uncharacterized protein n=1 Tax=Gracilibacillus oryzae TaxID=1672701 RepID=A0A7C8GRL8_9BACI|nr:hypothetical protein [Gracilibacillus oryzae]KAB8129170.1 hypothetical protein F9U64_15400 [Gracilibacillus oryzae]
MSEKPWKSYIFLALSLIVSLSLIVFFVMGFGGANQLLLQFMFYMFLVLGIASIIFGVWSFFSKTVSIGLNIVASILTIAHILVFFFSI